MTVQFPHCDPRILHAPGACQYCDESGLQEVRQAWNIAFTDQPDPTKTPCPGVVERGENLECWTGNKAKPSLDSVAAHLIKTEDIPRRKRRDLMTSAELTILGAMEVVEVMPADPRLTEAVILLQQARDKVADYVDGL